MCPETAHTHSDTKRAPGNWLLLLFLAAVMVRFAVLGSSIGSNDMRNWVHFGAVLEGAPLCVLYRNVELFNNPPLAGWFGAAAHAAARWSDLDMPLVFRAGTILADLGILFLVWIVAFHREEGSATTAALGYGLGLCSILISAFHGNTDALCLLLVFGSAFAAARGIPAWAGILFGASLGIKLIPSLAFFPLLAVLPSHRDRLRFMAGAAVVPVLMIPAVMGCGGEFLRKVVFYRSLLEPWGILLLLRAIAEAIPAAGSILLNIAVQINRHGGIGLLALSVILSCALVRQNDRDPFRAAFLAFTGFLLFAPGFGIQYLIYPLPFLCVLAPRRGALYGFVAGLFLLSVYWWFMGPELPFESFHTGAIPLKVAVLGALPYLVLLWSFLSAFKRSRSVAV